MEGRQAEPRRQGAPGDERAHAGVLGRHTRGSRRVLFEPEIADLLVTVPLGFALGFLIGLTGVGGGALVAPSLYVILGMAYADAVALSLVYSVFTKIVGAIQHLRQGTVLPRITVLYGLAGIPGAVIGSRLVYWAGGAGDRILPFVMAGMLLAIAVLIAAESSVQALAAREKPFSPHVVTWQGALGVAAFQTFVGALMGLTSIGSGSLVIVSMVFLFRMSAREIVGSNIVIALIMAAPAGLTHYLSAGMDWRRLAVLCAGSLVGAVLGARATMVLADRALKRAMATLIAIGAIATIVKAL